MTGSTPGRQIARAARARARRRAACSLACALAIGLACSAPKTQEQQIRETIEAIDRAASEKNTKALREAISESYRDEKNRNKEDLSAFITYFLFKNKNIYTFSFIYDIALPSEDSARAVVYAALAATPIKSKADIPRLSADLWRFEVELTRETAAWKVSSADWSPVDPNQMAELLF